MRNLKKSLALVLALVMVFGLCTIGAGAAFENETLQYTTPVQVMAGMGILTGDENGVFNPTGELTRAAAAKIVAYVALGKTAAEMMSAYEDFKDLKVSDPKYGWSVKYVHYLYTKGIVNGYGDGNYGPGDSVTVLQFAKMLLCAIGYGKQNEFVGAGWDANTLVKAIEVDMLVGLNSTDTDRVITREEASLFAFNTMTKTAAGVVTYSTLTNSYSTAGTTLGVSKYNYTAPVSGVVTANQATGAAYTVIGGVNYNITTGKELVGHYVSVYYANSAKTSATGATYYNVYSYTDVGTVKTYSATSTSFAAAVGTGVTYADPYYSITNYVSTSTAASAAPGVAPYGSYVVYNGQIVAYIANPTYTVDKVTAIVTTAGSESITFATAGTKTNTATNDVIVEYTGIAVGDYVTMTQIGTKFYVTKATTVEGTITAYTGTTSITLGGTAYASSTAVTDGSGIVDDALDFTSTFVLYLDEYGKFFAVTKKAAVAATNLFYVTGNFIKANYGDTAVTYDTYAKGINAAGEYVTYKIAKDATSTGAANGAAATIDTLYQVSVNASTGVATLTTPAATTGAAAISGMTGAAWNLSTTPGVVNKATSATGNYYLASDVTIIYVNDAVANQAKDVAPTVTIKTGVQAVNLDGSDYVIATKQTGTTNWTVNTVIYNGTAPLPVAASLIYSTGAAAKATVAYTGATGVASANLFDVYIDGVKTEIKSTDETIAAGFYTYTVNTYGITAVTTATSGFDSGAVTNYYNGLLSFGSVNDKNAANAVVVNLTTNTKAPTTVDQLASTETIAVTYSATGAITYIYITACSR
jgi:hypothetical protein